MKICSSLAIEIIRIMTLLITAFTKAHATMMVVKLVTQMMLKTEAVAVTSTFAKNI